MLKLLFVVDENRRGGVSVALENLIYELIKKECKIDILVLHDQGEMLNNFPENIKIIYGTPYFEAIDYNLVQVLKQRNYLLLMRKLNIVLGLKTGWIKRRIISERKKILDVQYDVEIAFKDGFAAVFTAVGDSKKKIHWLHSEYKNKNSNSKYPRIFKRILPLFDNIVAVSRGVEKQFNEIYHLENKTTVISNIVPRDKIIEKSKAGVEEYPKNKVNVVLVGRCHQDKGYMRLLDAICTLKNENKLENIAFHIVGDGPEQEMLKEKKKKEKLDSIVYFYGAKENPYIYMKSADWLMLPSVNESFGMVIVEAQMLGVPVVATRTAAAEELINHGITGWVVDNSFEGVLEGILKMQDKKQLLLFSENLQNYHYFNGDIMNKIDKILGV